MPFQVVELRLDAQGQVIDRRAIPYPYPQRLDAVRGWTRRITRRSAIFGRLSPKTGKRGSNLSSKASNHVWIEATRNGVSPKGLTIVGSITAEGLVWVNGHKDGDLHLHHLVIDKGAQISGTVSAR